MSHTFLSSFDERRLLVVDLDAILAQGVAQDQEALSMALHEVRDSLVLVYVSGRRVAEQVEAIEQQGLLLPDYIVSAVGTEVYRMPGEHPLDDWERYIGAGFDREEIVAYLANHRPQLQLQPAEQQTPLKISYLLKEAQLEQLDALQRELFKSELAVKIIYSHDLYLDVIPQRAGIGAAVKFLVDSLLLFPNQVFVCGDSGNDIDLFQYGFRGIVVANASHELKRAVELRAYFSHGSHASGLLEGLRHYNFFATAPRKARRDPTREAFDQAVSSLRRNITPLGFSAAGLAENPLTEDESNYFAVWSRDGIKTGLWSLGLNDPDITECFRRTLQLLAEHQTDAGQIPANVQIQTGTPDYSGTGNIASIDSVIWFIIGGCRYGAYRQDLDFLEWIYPSLRKAIDWLHAHDSNNCGLLELPESSDWMDLFPRSYNVLYAEVLWYLACRDFSDVCEMLGKDAGRYPQLTERVRQEVLRRFWPSARSLSETPASFSETQYSVGNAQYLLSQISPFDFSWRCDVYANLLAALMDMLDETKMQQLFQFLWGVGVNSPYPVACFYPAVQPGASDWKDYSVTNFLNLPHHYHNGGIWPFIGGLWVRFLAKIGKQELAHRELNSLAEACRVGIYGEWEFNEWMHGITGRPMGKAHQAWTSASYIAAYQALNHDMVPVDFAPLKQAIFDPSKDNPISST